MGHALRRGRGGGEAEPGRGGSHRARAQVFRARAERVGPGDRDARGRGRAAATGGVPGGRAHGDDRGTGEHGVHLTRAWSGLCRVKMRRRTRAAVAFKTCRFAANWLRHLLIIFARLPNATKRNAHGATNERCERCDDPMVVCFIRSGGGGAYGSSVFTWSCSCPASGASCACACSSSSRA